MELIGYSEYIESLQEHVNNEFECDLELENTQTFENLEDIDTMLESILTEEVDDSDVAAAKAGGKRTLKNYAGQAAGWTLFFPISLYRSLHKTIRKKAQISKLVKTESDLGKKAKLKVQLDAMSSKQVKLLKKINDEKVKAKDKADKASMDDSMKDKAAKTKAQIDDIVNSIKSEKSKD